MAVFSSRVKNTASVDIGGSIVNVKISNGNSKMGNIPSVSFPSLVTCIKCECNRICYAHKLENLRPNMKKAYLHNWNLYK